MDTKELVEERLLLTNQLIKLQGRAYVDETKEHIQVILERLKILDSIVMNGKDKYAQN